MSSSQTWRRQLTRDEFFYVAEDNYDEFVEMAIPYYREMHREMVRVACALGKASMNVLDLGSGTGKTSYCLLKHAPVGMVRAIDLFPEMHRHARKRLARFIDRVEYITGDFMAIELGHDLDLCVSSLAIHHQAPKGKKRLFSRIFEALKPDGALLMIDWTKYADPFLQEEAAQAAERHARQGVRSSKAAEEWCAHWRQKNLPETTDDLCAWLKESGFAHADCIFRYYGIALLCARKC